MSPEEYSFTTLNPSDLPSVKVDHLICAKVHEIEAERAQNFIQVGRTFEDGSLQPLFIRSLKDFVGLDSSNELLVAIRIVQSPTRS